MLCGELSLMAAQTNPGELMRAHVALERKNTTVNTTATATATATATVNTTATATATAKIGR